MKEYEFEHSLRHETVRRKEKISISKSDEVTLTNSLSVKAALEETEPTTPYSPYTENGNE